ncbi:50S ribosomal protein L21 [Ascidiaceihabitans sp.]|nr:50S ribosomal protein L21 [Ascidiaceihabitans sp.]MDB4196742.1 50S ribosomal protein L21 [Ascidiaceihabitans sp.]
MFAVLKTGGKQYKVQSGDVLRVEKLAAIAGQKIQFNDVLMLGGDTVTVGAPLVAGAGVQAEVIDQIKGVKTINFVKRRRKHSSKRTKGHRQKLTLVRITDILASDAAKSGVDAAVGAGSVGSVALAAIDANTPAANKDQKRSAAPKAAVAKAAPKAAGGDDLTAITGVGPAAAKKLVEAGIATFADLAKVDVATFDAVKVKPEWVAQAADLTK